MTKTSTLTSREAEILANASRYSVVVKGYRSEWESTELAERAGAAAAEHARRGAAMYAIGEVCGIEASALIATYQPRKGWVYMTNQP